MKLSELKYNESVILEYRTLGCFHHSQIELTFNGSNSRLVRIVENGPQNTVTEVEISEDVVEILDHLFEYWRSPQNQRMSLGTSDCDIRLTWVCSGAQLDSEDFKHAYPPAKLRNGYVRFFWGTIIRAIRARKKQIVETKRDLFRKWALENQPVKEVRFLDDTTVYAVLLPDHHPTDHKDSRWMAYCLAKACSEQVDSKLINCKLYLRGKISADYTFKR